MIQKLRDLAWAIPGLIFDTMVKIRSWFYAVEPDRPSE